MKNKQTDKKNFFPFIEQTDPRTGKASPLPAVQKELNQNGPLPVSSIMKNKVQIYLILKAHWEIRTLADGRVYYIDHRKNQFQTFLSFELFSLILVNKTTTWTDPRIAGPVRFDIKSRLICYFLLSPSQ